MTIDEIANLSMECDDFEQDYTIREYLKDLLLTLWQQKERFNSKRPFGNSGWEYDLYKPLIKAGLIEGKLDNNGYVEDVNEAEADAIIDEVIVLL